MSLPELRTSVSVLERPVSLALERVANSLSEMAGLPITLSSSSLELVPLAQVSAVGGAADEVAVGIYVSMAGEGQGHLLLLMDESAARRFAALLLMDDESNISLEQELAVSALAEAGNVGCSAFMNALGDASGLRLEATPPVVALDMRGALLQAVIYDIALMGDDALVIGTHLQPEETAVAGAIDVRVVVIPSPDTLDQLLTRLTAAEGIQP